ncbi:MAG TPA: hypothetical protein VJ761_09470 [Ktedonobacteraceae bacterium]|nr:hypothetical protein [Ktedonobacteraceae bacterium]
MLLSMKKGVVLVVMAFALIAGLLGWTVRTATIQTVPQHHTSTHSSQLADDPNWYCPAPPRNC